MKTYFSQARNVNVKIYYIMITFSFVTILGKLPDIRRMVGQFQGFTGEKRRRRPIFSSLQRKMNIIRSSTKENDKFR
jgi:hypothetical protein